MTRGLVLDPTSFVDLGGASAGPPLGSLAGKTIGFRHDMYWRSWTWVVEEWGAMVQADGAAVAYWEHRPPTGKETAGMLESLDAFLAGVDAAVVGMANCGSCTMWTIHDALRSLDRGLPTVVAATEHFVDLARGLAKRSGRGEIRLQALPFPFEGLPEAEVRELARSLYQPMLAVLGAEVAVA
jgi:hypothetical protein